MQDTGVMQVLTGHPPFASWIEAGPLSNLDMARMSDCAPERAFSPGVNHQATPTTDYWLPIRWPAFDHVDRPCQGAPNCPSFEWLGRQIPAILGDVSYYSRRSTGFCKNHHTPHTLLKKVCVRDLGKSFGPDHRAGSGFLEASRRHAARHMCLVEGPDSRIQFF